MIFPPTYCSYHVLDFLLYNTLLLLFLFSEYTYGQDSVLAIVQN